MDTVGSGERIRDDESARARISLGDDPHLIAQLQAKLEEYLERASKRPDTTYDHPEFQALQLGAAMFQADVLAYVLSAAEQRDTKARPIELREVAEACEERHGYDLTPVKEAPVILDSYYDIYCHNQRALAERGGQLNCAFSQAYWVVQAYTSGQTSDLRGGTGLPEVNND